MGMQPLEVQQQINQVITQTKYEPMIGETNGVSNRTNGENALVEMDLYNWSIINKDYYIPVITAWQNDGTYELMNKKLGYRFSLKHSTFNFQNNILNNPLKAPFIPKSTNTIITTISTGFIASP